MNWMFLGIGVVFAGFAIVQVNDPDPIVWVLLYGLVAVASFALALRRCPTWLAAGVCVVLVGAAAYQLPALGQLREGSLTMQRPDSISDEEVREAGGLLLGALASIAILHRARREAAASRPGAPTSSVQKA